MAEIKKLPSPRKEIETRLVAIEEEHDVRIVYAVESGSRVWGFESALSDYDVRFLYVRPQDDYLRLDVPRDTIERMDDIYDLSGWDIFKALRLLRKYNPPLMEWLHSPIVYRDELGPLLWALRHYVSQCAQTPSIYHHYKNMASGNYKQYILNPLAFMHSSEKTLVPLKKYLYVLRPLSVLLYVEKYGALPATQRFDEVLTALDLPDNVAFHIRDLIERKRTAGSLGDGSPIYALNSWIDETFARLEAHADDWHDVVPYEMSNKLDEVLRLILLRHSPRSHWELEAQQVASETPLPPRDRKPWSAGVAR